MSVDTRVRVGRVAALWRYPIKSMAAEPLSEADVSWHGLVGDRRWAFIRPGLERSGFPWLTIRERPAMRHYRPRFEDPSNPNGSKTVVQTPAGQLLDAVDPALAAELGEGVRVIKQNVGVFDTMPLSLITTQTVAGLSALVGDDLEIQRFRPNILVEVDGEESFPEDTWVGGVLRVGELRMRADQRDRRCVMVNIDPATDARDPGVLRAIAHERQNCLGIYGTTVQPGRIAVGDAVFLEPPEDVSPPRHDA
jgi:MOSC domain-containing protein